MKCILKKIFFPLLLSFIAVKAFSQTLPCDVVQIQHNPNTPVLYAPDSSKYFIVKQDTIGGVFQIYVGNVGDTNTVCISDSYTMGNCCGLYRHWKTRNKVMAIWHPSGNYIICGVEKEFYPELLFVPYNLRLGWIWSGVWLDIWAVKPDGSQWYNLATTIHGMTGPAFTPGGTKCVYAEAQDSRNLATDKFGVWKFQQADFVVNSGTPSFANTTDISPAGAHWLEPGNFSPDGTLLLFNADIGMTNAEGQDQYILDITNGNVINLTNSPTVWDEHGVFSPDGNKILFMSSYPYRSDTNSYHTLSIKTEFMLMNTDGSGLQQLTHFRDTGYIESSPGIAATGFWRPDGKRIFAQSLIFPDYDNWFIDFYDNCGNATLGINENILSDNDLLIFPNPAQSFFTVEIPNQNFSLQIFDATGRKIYFQKNIFSKTEIDCSGFSNGIYFVQITSGEDFFAQKFIKK